METMTALSIINQLPSKREEMQRFHALIKSELLASKNPLKDFAQLKCVAETLKNIFEDKDLRHLFLKEIQKYDNKEVVSFNGVELYQMEASVKYHFEDTGDAIYFDLIKEMELLKEKIKERENFLKNLPPDGAVCSQNGNFLNRPFKKSETIVACKIK